MLSTLLLTCALGAWPSQADSTPARQDATSSVARRTGARGVSPEEIIAVARDVAPEWASMLEKARAEDPAAFQAAMTKGSRRLASLAVLRARKPQLYALRIEEIRVQGEIEGLVPLWVSASLGGRIGETKSLEARVRGLSGTLVDLNLRSRAMELAEIDAVMRTMRSELERDSRGREASVERMVAACREGRASTVLGGRSPVDTLPADAAASGSATPPSGNPANPNPNAPNDAKPAEGGEPAGASAAGDRPRR